MAFLRWFIGKIILFLDAAFAPTSVQRPVMAQEKINKALENLSIYEFAACPFCVKVRRFMKRENISVLLRDARRDPFRAELLAGGGKVQVPCLRIQRADGSVQWMYESNDIIAYLQQRLSAS